MATDFANALALKAFGMTLTQANEQGICIACKMAIRDERVVGEETGEPGQIYSDLGMQEYRISGLCETCYDTLEG